MQVADPLVAKVLDPVDPEGEKIKLSELMAMVTLATAILINVSAVPMG